MSANDAVRQREQGKRPTRPRPKPVTFTLPPRKTKVKPAPVAVEETSLDRVEWKPPVEFIDETEVPEEPE